jgi:hypothetical protein
MVFSWPVLFAAVSFALLASIAWDVSIVRARKRAQLELDAFEAGTHLHSDEHLFEEEVARQGRFLRTSITAGLALLAMAAFALGKSQGWM